jgi:hypothetical protein
MEFLRSGLTPTPSVHTHLRIGSGAEKTGVTGTILQEYMDSPPRTLNNKQAGFSVDTQVRQRNIPRVGHCLTCRSITLSTALFKVPARAWKLLLVTARWSFFSSAVCIDVHGNSDCGELGALCSNAPWEILHRALLSSH